MAERDMSENTYKYTYLLTLYYYRRSSFIKTTFAQKAKRSYIIRRMLKSNPERTFIHICLEMK